MKRIKFLSGISAMCAFAVIALAGSLMTSCEKDDFDATFRTKPAQATINVTVYDLATGAELSGATISASGNATVSGMTVTLTGNATDGSLGEQDVTISVVSAPTYYDIVEKSSATVHVYALSAGGAATYKAELFVSPAFRWEITEVAGTNIVYELLAPEHDQLTSGEIWSTNYSDREISVPVTYTSYNVVTLVSNSITDAEASVEAEKLIKNMESKVTEKVTEDVPVPAWNEYRVTYTVYPKTITYEAFKGNTSYGKVVFDAMTDGALQPYYNEIPGHDHTHGHADTTHGSDNAGGGEGAAD